MIQFKSHSGIYTLETTQMLNTNIDKAWKLLSDPKNLEKITPSEMNFTITSEGIEPMYAGQIISYKVTPFAGLRSNWITEITHVREKEYFVDEQRFGPYKMWHHEHRIAPHENGILMTDKISYKLPFGFLGKIAHPLIVKKQLTKIFQYREQVLNEMFNS
ncbi:SRPBCC family protein [Salinivirga cyanobacteriivorans]